MDATQRCNPLPEEGWIKRDFPFFLSPDGEHSAQIFILTEEDIPRHVLIYFSHAD